MISNVCNLNEDSFEIGCILCGRGEGVRKW